MGSGTDEGRKKMERLGYFALNTGIQTFFGWIIAALFLLAAASVFIVNSRKPKGSCAAPDEESVIDRIQKADSGFQPQAFREYALQVYRALQSASDTRNPGALLPYLTEEMACRIRKELDAPQDGHCKKEGLNGVYFTDYREEAGKEYITVYLYADSLAVTADDNRGRRTEKLKKRVPYCCWLCFQRVAPAQTEEKRDEGTIDWLLCGYEDCQTAAHGEKAGKGSGLWD